MDTETLVKIAIVNDKNIRTYNLKYLENENLSLLLKATRIKICKLSDKDKKVFSSLDNLNKCKYLICENLGLTALPKLNGCIKLLCNKNKLRVLPYNLNNCQEIYCSDNRLNSLPPALPSCRIIRFSNNNVKKLPKFSQDIESIKFYSNNVLYFTREESKLLNINFESPFETLVRNYYLNKYRLPGLFDQKDFLKGNFQNEEDYIIFLKKFLYKRKEEIDSNFKSIVKFHLIK